MSSHATRATSHQTRKAAWCAIPCASVSAKRTWTSVENENPSTRAKRNRVFEPPYDCGMSVARLAELIAANQPCVVLTGAGISTESGIPDFRSPTGIWARYDPVEVATIEAFRRDPTRVWEFYARRLGILGDVEPNPGHLAIAELERRGFVQAVVTQNVDGLHQRAGSRDVIEVHGSLRDAVCPRCSAVEPMTSVLRQLADEPVPACPACGEVLKPGVVMFGELLPAAAID